MSTIDLIVLGAIAAFAAAPVAIKAMPLLKGVVSQRAPTPAAPAVPGRQWNQQWVDTLINLQGELESRPEQAEAVTPVSRAGLDYLKSEFGITFKTSPDKYINLEDMSAEEDMVIAITHSGYIKRNPISLYRTQRRGGRGKVGMGTKEEDFVSMLFIASMHSYVMFFSNVGS